MLLTATVITAWMLSVFNRIFGVQNYSQPQERQEEERIVEIVPQAGTHSETPCHRFNIDLDNDHTNDNVNQIILRRSAKQEKKVKLSAFERQIS